MKNITMKMWSGVVLGTLFVVSGFVKAVDPVGLSYKIEEYLELFQLSSWSIFSMSLSILLCVIEMTLGLLLLLRLWCRITTVVVTLFILGFTILTYLIYTDPYGGINECGCFGEALHLSNETTFSKNILLLVVATIHSWNVFKQAKNSFNYRQIGLTIGVLVVALFVPLYSYFYLPPFDFLPYNIGTSVEAKNTINFFNSDFNNVTEKVFANGKPTYMIGMRKDISWETSRKIATLYNEYQNGTINLFAVASKNGITMPSYNDIPVYFMDNVVLKSILRTSVGVVAFTADRRISGKWNLLYTPYRFERGYGKELSEERVKRGAFFGFLVVIGVLLFYERKKMEG